MKWITLLSLFIFLLTACLSDKQASSTFQKLPSDFTKIDFRNDLIESPESNILEYLYFYNGSGVAVEDINNDGLPDIYFGSNQKADQLYINLGNFKFENASHLLPSEHLQGWTTGVNMVDINADGWMDIYVSRLALTEGTSNKLFINQKGKSFIEKSASWGLDLSGYCTHSSFFDYDNDGDLDCYILKHSEKDPDQFKKSSIRHTTDEEAGDLLLENVGNRFTDKTQEAQIYSSAIGFGLGVSTSDVNNDGWMDIYVCNDFHEQDYLYINNKDKTFTETIHKSTGHTSNFSMGCSIEDINNDGSMDIISLDMKPFDDAIYKKSGGWENIQIYNFKRSFGYHHQSPRNALQINSSNKGPFPTFSEQACFNGIEASDWSWTPLVADFDNDGDKDIYISNGIVKRPNDMDFVNFEYNGQSPNKFEQLENIPSGKVPNVYYENDGLDKKFIRSFDQEQTASTSSAYADLNLDGRLDIVINNINDEATIIKNTKPIKHYLRVKLKSIHANINAIGAKVELYCQGKTQTASLNSSNGFLSHNEGIIHFGLGLSKPDSLIIHWPDHTIQKFITSATDTLLTIEQENSLLTDISKPEQESGSLTHIEGYTPDKSVFNGQESNKWLLFNEYSTSDHLEILNNELTVIAPNSILKGTIIEGNFIPSSTKTSVFPNNLLSHLNINEILFYSKADHNLDKQNDFFIHTTSGSFVFLSEKNMYTKIQLNISDDVKSAAWGDVDGDAKLELVVAGLWMPISIIHFDQDNHHSRQDIPDSEGWWSKVSLVDLNQNGKKDIIGGNFGTNHSLSASNKHPIQSYKDDFDRNGSTEKLVTYYSEGRQVPYPNQMLFVDQLPYAKKKFLKNVDYVNSSFMELLGNKKIEAAQKQKITELRSCYFINNSGWHKKILPSSLQLSPLYTIEHLYEDIFIFGGNLFDVDPNLGRQDAGEVQILQYQNNNWIKLSGKDATAQINGEVRSIKIFRNNIYCLDRQKGIIEITSEKK